MSSHASSGRQSIHDVSLSWQNGLLLPPLGAAALVARGDHRHPVGQAQRRHQVRGLPVPQREHVRVVGLALDPAVPRPVVVRAVAVVLAVGPVVLLVVGHEVAQGEPVVGGHEVDRGVRRAPVVAVQVTGAGQPGRDVADRALAPPEVAHGVAELVVPLGPLLRQRADQVAVHRGVPRLGDQLHVPQDRVLRDRGQQVAPHVDLVAGAGQRREQVEAEAVDVHLGHPVAQRVEDEPQRHRVVGVRRCCRSR